MNSEMPNGKSAPRVSAKVLVIGVALAAITGLSAGCSTTSTSDVVARDHDHHKRHPIMISEEPESFTVPVGMKGPALSPEIETALRDYVDEYRANGTGGVTIQVPTGSANEVAAASTGRAVHYALVRAGVPHGSIKVAPYPVNDRSKVASLRVSYLRVKAVAPRCGVWPDGLDSDFSNAQYHNFGCSSQQNLAAMVDNPADFVRPRQMTPPHGARRAKVIADYAAGEDPKSNVALTESGTTGE